MGCDFHRTKPARRHAKEDDEKRRWAFCTLTDPTRTRLWLSDLCMPLGGTYAHTNIHIDAAACAAHTVKDAEIKHTLNNQQLR